MAVVLPVLPHYYYHLVSANELRDEITNAKSVHSYFYVGLTKLETKSEDPVRAVQRRAKKKGRHPADVLADTKFTVANVNVYYIPRITGRQASKLEQALIAVDLKKTPLFLNQRHGSKTSSVHDHATVYLRVYT